MEPVLLTAFTDGFPAHSQPLSPSPPPCGVRPVKGMHVPQLPGRKVPGRSKALFSGAGKESIRRGQAGTWPAKATPETLSKNS